MKRLKLMADYGCDPLWHSGGEEAGCIDPVTLPLSSELIQKLALWQYQFDRILNPDDPLASGFSTPEAEMNWLREAEALCKLLRQELGPEYEIWNGHLTRAA